MSDGTNTLYFYYGADGVTGFTFNNEDFYYKKNAQNDIISIYSTNGEEIIRYFYDAWGNHIAEIVDTNENMSYTDNVQKLETLAKLNPFRYRGYIYDEERIVVVKICYQKFNFTKEKNEKQDVYDNFLLFVSVIDLFVDNGCWKSAVD